MIHTPYHPTRIRRQRSSERIMVHERPLRVLCWQDIEGVKIVESEEM